MFKDERGWVIELPGTNKWKRDVLIFSHANVARGLHYPITQGERRIITVLRGMIWDYSKSWAEIYQGNLRVIGSGLHGFLSPIESLVLFQSSVKHYREPRRANFKKIFPQINTWMRSKADLLA